MKALKRVLLIVAGTAAIILGIVTFSMSTGSWTNYARYGGDAYTGIQNASADGARNVQKLTEIAQMGFGSILLVGGVTLIASALPDRKATELPVKTEPEQQDVSDELPKL